MEGDQFPATAGSGYQNPRAWPEEAVDGLPLPGKQTRLVVFRAVVHEALLKVSDGDGGQIFGVETAEPEALVQDAEQPHPSLEPAIEP